MTKAQLETKLRNTFLNFITEQVQTAFDTDVLPVSASDLAIPCLDDEGNEKFVLIRSVSLVALGMAQVAMTPTMAIRLPKTTHRIV